MGALSTIHTVVAAYRYSQLWFHGDFMDILIVCHIKKLMIWHST
jgi:hypothetical protein